MREIDNLRPALLCAECAVLLAWDWTRQGELLDYRTTGEEFAKLFSAYLNVSTAYAHELTPFALCAMA